MKTHPNQRWPDKNKSHAGISSKEISQEKINPLPFKKETKETKLQTPHATEKQINNVEESMYNQTPYDIRHYPDRMVSIYLTRNGDFVGWGSDTKPSHNDLAVRYASELGIDPNQDDDDSREYKVMFDFMKKTNMIRSTSTKDEFFVNVVGKPTTSQLKTIRELANRSDRRFVYDIEPNYKGKSYSGHDFRNFMNDLRNAGLMK